jgi:hypothetical protein
LSATIKLFDAYDRSIGNFTVRNAASGTEPNFYGFVLSNAQTNNATKIASASVGSSAFLLRKLVYEQPRPQQKQSMLKMERTQNRSSDLKSAAELQHSNIESRISTLSHHVSAAILHSCYVIYDKCKPKPALSGMSAVASSKLSLYFIGQVKW